MGPSDRQVIGHLPNLPRSALLSLLNIPLTSILEGHPWKDLNKPLIIKELILHHLVLGEVVHLSGTQIHVGTIDFNPTLTHSFQLHPLPRVLLRTLLGRCEW